MSISVVEQLVAIAAAERAGYAFNASEVATVTELEYEFIDADTGYHYFFDIATGDVTCDAPWQTHA